MVASSRLDVSAAAVMYIFHSKTTEWREKNLATHWKDESSARWRVGIRFLSGKLIPVSGIARDTHGCAAYSNFQNIIVLDLYIILDILQ